MMAWLEADQELAAEAAEQQAGATMVTVPFLTTGFLSDGETQVAYSPLGGMVSLYGPGNDHRNHVITPIDMGVMGEGGKLNPAYVIDVALKKEGFHYRFFGEREIRGINVLVVELGQAGSTKTYGFDPDRGYLPVYIATEIGDMQLFITDVRECSNGRWFPDRSVGVMGATRQQGDYYVRVIEVVDLEVDTAPNDDAFSLGLPEGTLISDVTVPESMFRLSAAMDVGPGDLDRLMERGREAVSNREGSAEPQGGWSSGRTLAVVTSVLVAVFVVLALVKRRGGTVQ